MTSNRSPLELPSNQLAAWLDNQDADVWWLVDGDPLLTGNISFPCPGDVLAEELRRIDQTLFLIPPEEAKPKGQHITSEDLDDLAYLEQDRGERTFLLRWAKPTSTDNWLLIEDNDSAKLARGLDESEED